MLSLTLTISLLTRCPKNSEYLYVEQVDDGNKPTEIINVILPISFAP